MLVLSRKVGERILIGESKSNDQVVVQVLGMDGHKVRIGIHAPASIRVDREEVAIARHGLDGNGGVHVDHS